MRCYEFGCLFTGSSYAGFLFVDLILETLIEKGYDGLSSWFGSKNYSFTSFAKMEKQ